MADLFASLALTMFATSGAFFLSVLFFSFVFNMAYKRNEWDTDSALLFSTGAFVASSVITTLVAIWTWGAFL